MSSVHTQISSLSPSDFATDNNISGNYRASDPAALPAAEINLVKTGGKRKSARKGKSARKSRKSRKSCVLGGNSEYAKAYSGGKSKKRSGSRRR